MRSFSFIATSFIAVAALLTSVPLAAQDNPRDYTGGPRYGA